MAKVHYDLCYHALSTRLIGAYNAHMLQDVWHDSRIVFARARHDGCPIADEEEAFFNDRFHDKAKILLKHC